MHIEEKQKMLKEYEDSLTGKTFEELEKIESELIAEADVNFHDVIYEATNNPKLVSLLNNLREQVYRYRVEYIKDANNHPILISEHEDIIRAIENKDKEAVTQAMYVHVSNQATAVKEVIQKQG